MHFCSGDGESRRFGPRLGNDRWGGVGEGLKPSPQRLGKGTRSKIQTPQAHGTMGRRILWSGAWVLCNTLWHDGQGRGSLEIVLISVEGNFLDGNLALSTCCLCFVCVCVCVLINEGRASIWSPEAAMDRCKEEEEIIQNFRSDHSELQK